MKRNVIPPNDLALKIYDLWSEHWILLTAGDFASGKFNTMAIGWGGLGNMWGKPFAHVVVRPGRYTHEFMEKYDTFTICAFAEKYAKAVQLLGRSPAARATRSPHRASLPSLPRRSRRRASPRPS